MSANLQMGAFLSKPNLEKVNDSGSCHGLTYSAASMQGWRVEMEDTHCAVKDLPITESEHLQGWSFFAVFDGHAGKTVSQYCAEHLASFIGKSDAFKQIKCGQTPSDDAVKLAIRDGFLSLDSHMRQLEQLAEGKDKSGSTAVCALISPEKIYLINCGDSRAIIISKDNVQLATTDHKPINSNEKQRIVNAGGAVMMQRINGSLAVSRSFGDYDFKQLPDKSQIEQLVSPEPEIFVHERQSDSDQLVVLACDGIWDALTNENVCAYLCNRFKVTNDLVEISNRLLDTALYSGSKDNMTVVLIGLPGRPSVDSNSLEADKRVNNLIRDKVEEKLAERPDADLAEIISHLNAEIGKDLLPPGGGLPSKRHIILETIREHQPDFDPYQ